MMIYDVYFFYIIHLLILFIQINGSIKSYKFEQQLGSTIILPPCLSTLSSSADDVTVRKIFNSFFSMVDIYFGNFFYVDDFV
jgi:hypothetical protein